jgi:hypothetical protein
MLPTTEIDRLSTAVEQADSLAASGRLMDGYMLLLEGRRRAERFAHHGAAWGKALVWRWRQACDNYTARYGPSPQE